MENPFRLHSATMFDRVEETNQEDPQRIVFLSVEGNKTERQYLNYVHQFRETLGIKKGVHIHPLRRKSADNRSMPQDVLELLEECIDIHEDRLPDILKPLIPEKYDRRFIADYLAGKEVNNQLKSDFERLLLQAGIDLEYQKYLNNYKTEEDVFGVVIDRDHGCHSVELLNDLKVQCEQKGYKFFLTTPCFEFWLLLHLTDVNTTYSSELQAFRENATVSGRHTKVSQCVASLAGHAKSINETKFTENYLPKIDYAIAQVNKDFSTDLSSLIGDNSSDDAKLGSLGSNLSELFSILREQ